MVVSTSIPSSPNSTDCWENEGGASRPATSVSEDTEAAALKQYGITPVQLTVFDWGGYRYSNSRDAIAAAKRGARLTEGGADLQ